MYVITGASDGLGLELAKLLAKKGEKVVSLSRSKPKEEGIAHIQCDLTNEGSINVAAKAVLDLPDKLHALVNCAGVYAHQSLENLTGQETARIYTTNIIGPLLLTARLMTRLKKDEADVLNVASTAGTKGSADGTAYGSSKWAVRGFSQSLREELRSTQCRVISFCPGWFQPQAGPDWMTTKDVAAFTLQILQLPKNMEVSEVIVNRK